MKSHDLDCPRFILLRAGPQMNSLTAVGILANTAYILSVWSNCKLLKFPCKVKKQRTVMRRFELLVSRLCMLFQNPKGEACCKSFMPRRNRRCYTLYHFVEGNGFSNRVYNCRKASRASRARISNAKHSH